jgi:hypothetical protein
MPVDHPTETFRPVPGFLAYEVSDWGRIRRRFQYWGGHSYLKTEPAPSAKYRQIWMRDDKGKPHRRHLHLLILEAFVGPRPEGMQCRHLDGNPFNNRLDNLKWGTAVENGQDRVRHGTQVHGITNPKAKLTEQQVREIRDLHEQGLTGQAIARLYGISKSTACLICKRSIWRHI